MYFASVVTDGIYCISETPENQCYGRSDLTIPEDDVQKELQLLSETKSCGIDAIPPIVYKNRKTLRNV